MDFIRQDIRDGWHSLIRNRGLTVVAVLTLSLGIGASTAIFSVVNAVVLKPLPYSEPDRLYWVHTWSAPNRWAFSVVDFQALQEQATVFSGTAGFSPRAMTYSAPSGSQRVLVNRTTADFFSVLGSRPLLGRTFEAGEDSPGAQPVAVLSHGFWQRQFGANASVLGSTLRLDGADHTIVGVLPEAVGPIEATTADLWTTLELAPPTRKGPFFIRVIARLEDGATSQQAQDELRRLSHELFPLWQESYQDASATWGMLPLRDYVVADSAAGLYLIFAAVGSVLLIASINLGSLLLACVLSRRSELAVRTAIGASRIRLFRQLLAETLGVALLGGLGGTLWSYWGTRWLIAMVPDRLPRANEIAMDWQVLTFTLTISICGGLVVGLAPALRGSAADMGILLRAGARTTSSRSSAGRLLVVSQFALALPVLICSGLLLKSFLRIQNVDPGFDAERVVSLRVGLPPIIYPADADVAAFWERALTRIQALPGVESAGLGDGRPPQDVSDINNFDLESRPTPQGESQPTAPWLTVTPGYFRALGIPLLRGRLVEESDSPGMPEVVVVDSAWVRRHFPNGDPVGQRLMSGGCTPGNCDWLTIVGIVGDVKYTGLDNIDGTMYYPHAQAGYRNMYIFARSSTGNASALLPEIRHSIAGMDSMLVVSDVRSGDALIADSLLRRRFLMRLVSAFGLLAAVLAGLGIYGVMSYFVEQRTREIGVRMALGGDRSSVLTWLLGHGMRLTLSGLALGLLGAALATRYLSSLLFGVGTSDPMTFVVASLMLATVSMFACWFPARRACQVDPIVVLRAD